MSLSAAAGSHPFSTFKIGHSGHERRVALHLTQRRSDHAEWRRRHMTPLRHVQSGVWLKPKPLRIVRSDVSVTQTPLEDMWSGVGHDGPQAGAARVASEVVFWTLRPYPYPKFAGSLCGLSFWIFDTAGAPRTRRSPLQATPCAPTGEHTDGLVGAGRHKLLN